MTRKKFDIRVSDRKMIEVLEKKLKYINGYDYNNRTTKLDLYGEKNVLPIIRYDILNRYDEVIHGFSTRLGGVSTEHLSSLNLSFSRGDNPKNVVTNHKIFAAAVGYDYRKLVFSDQVHDIKIHRVTEADAGKGIERESDITGVDGLVTDVPGIPLITFYADCVPLYFYDPVKKVAAVAHSGWKGTVKHIGTVMIDYMVENYGCMPEHIVCAIGPSICKDCYEVSEDVALEFSKAYDEEQYFQMISSGENGKYQLDLHMACYYNLINAGVKKENIALPDLCTCCNSKFLFSHRASMGKRGNLAAVIMIKD